MQVVQMVWVVQVVQQMFKVGLVLRTYRYV